MILPGESTTKGSGAVFFPNPNGIIRGVINCPLSLGRNFDEPLRVIVARQKADNLGVAIPADFHPGDEVICSSCWFVRGS